MPQWRIKAVYPRPYGNYVLLERIGTGGMSEVDLARKGEDPDLVRFLVIKRIKADRVDDDAFVRMFKDEARITSELHHANIAQVYDFGRVGDEYYLALEYVPGLDVRRIINALRQRHERVPLNVAFRILIDVLEGLHYAHTKVDTLGNPMNIVHRDVNPRNIMVSVRGDVKLIDFGVARATNRLERTRTDHVKGKFAYMAPEQVDGSNVVDGRVDVFALGLTFHEMLMGYGPFSGLSQVQIVHRLVSGNVPALAVPPEYPDPERLLAVHAKALAAKPEDRFATAKDFAHALEAAASVIGGAATKEELVSFIARVEPTLQKEVRSKLHSYSGPVDVSNLRTMAADEEASMSGVNSVSLTRPVTITRGGVVAAGSLLGVGLLGVVLALGMAIVLVLYQGTIKPGESVGGASVGDALEVETRPLPGTEVERERLRTGVVGIPESPAEAPPEPAAPIAVSAPPVGSPKPVSPPAPALASDPSPPTPVTPEPETVAPVAPQPQIRVRPALAPEPEPAPVSSQPSAMGLLQINAADSGRLIYIDGVATPHRTPARFEWPVGAHQVTVEGYDGAKSVDVREGQSRALVFR